MKRAEIDGRDLHLCPFQVRQAEGPIAWALPPSSPGHGRAPPPRRTPSPSRPAPRRGAARRREVVSPCRPEWRPGRAGIRTSGGGRPCRHRASRSRPAHLEKGGDPAPPIPSSLQEIVSVRVGMPDFACVPRLFHSPRRPGVPALTGRSSRPAGADQKNCVRPFRHLEKGGDPAPLPISAPIKGRST